ncbi:hypothetical protein [Vibrio splendidus]|uniref:hypothetical protein n=1 Tax=Vibrio splendidus TaxID=29497 RepID=UPI00021C35E3|nr:hypothetical protein VISP3789_08603 [Vibrio splendidus ATCC 33789]
MENFEKELFSPHHRVKDPKKEPTLYGFLITKNNQQTQFLVNCLFVINLSLYSNITKGPLAFSGFVILLRAFISTRLCLKPMVKEQNAENSPGFRETERVLKVGYKTVLRTYKKAHTKPSHNDPFRPRQY